MFTDMVGYAGLAQADEGRALRLLEEHNQRLRPVFARYAGREVKTVGDAFLVEFASALEAVECAIAVQAALAERPLAGTDGTPVQVRIGIHVGDVVQTESDVLGDAVNIASRIQPLADPGGICLTQQVYDQVQNKIARAFVRMPPTSLKHIRTPVVVYKLGPALAAPRTAAPASDGHHLAVLPLSNISPDPNDEYFADGLTEELISVLSQVRSLSVIARTSVTPYKTAAKSIAEVGAELGVDTVLEGSVRKAGHRLRISLQLVDVATQRPIWASSYNRELDDVFQVQSDIAERTAEALRLQLATGEPAGATRRLTPNLEAYDHYLRGLAESGRMRGTRVENGVREFEAATRLDPTFAEAYAAWANLYVIVAGDSMPMAEVMPKARELVERALTLDPESAEAHATLGNILFQSDNDWARAEAEFRRAIALNPSNVVGRRFFGIMLMALGRFDEARDVLMQATRLDPAGSHPLTLTLNEVYAGRYDTALQMLQRELEEDPSSVSRHLAAGMFYLAAGRPDDARREADRSVEGLSETDRFDLGFLRALLGNPEMARQEIAEYARGESKEYTSATHIALLHAALREPDRALDLLEQAYRDGDRVLWLYYRGFWFDGMRDQPRFVALLRQYGLPLDVPKNPNFHWPIGDDGQKPRKTS